MAVAERLTFDFADGAGLGRDVLGGKGAGLVDMAGLGLPVPPGFVIGTPCGRAFLRDGCLPAALDGELAERMAALEAQAGRRFGDPAAPLLVSVRSGAAVSMPGMMDTVLNVGLSPAAAETLGGETGDPEFGWACFERLLEGFARTVRGIGAGAVEDALLDAEPSPRARCAALLDLLDPFPDPAGQLREALEAVFRSWRTPRAQAYRRLRGIDEQLGTAAVVQAMVFGNRGGRSGSGVAFTRDPSTGARGAYGDFLFGAQGEDVVAGERDTGTLEELGGQLPALRARLDQTLAALERRARDMCEVEFTVEDGRLWVLQTRVGQRSGRAAVRIAVALVREGVIGVEEALERVSDEQLAAARAPVFGGPPPDVLATGLAASPGAALGIAALDAERAQALHAEGAAVILLRPTTAPADVPGVIASAGVVTGRGGRTSHAAVVARGMGRPAVCGAGDLRVSADGRSATLNGNPVREGEPLAVDGDRGIVARGAPPLAAPDSDPALAQFLRWAAPDRTPRGAAPDHAPRCLSRGADPNHAARHVQRGLDSAR